MKNLRSAERQHPLAWLSLLALCCGPLLVSSVALAEAADSEIAENASAQRYSADWSLAAGTVVPLLAAQDQSGTRRQLADLVGRKGLLLVLVRSADW